MRKGMAPWVLALLGGIIILLVVLGINVALDPTSGFRDFLNKVPWLNKIIPGGSNSTGTSAPVQIPTTSFKDYPTWSQLSISPAAPAVKWSSPPDQATACKSKIESLFDPAKNANFNSFRDVCLYGDSDFLSEPYDLGANCKVEANTLVSYVSSVCRSQINVFGLDHRVWLLPTKNCGQVHREKFNDIRFNCGLDNICSGVIKLYYDEDDKGVGICDGNTDIPAIKDAATAQIAIIKWIDDRITDSEQSTKDNKMCESLSSDCTMVINIPEPGFAVGVLMPKIKENIAIDMGIEGVFNENWKFQEYSEIRKCGLFGWSECGGVVRGGVRLSFLFDDPYAARGDKTDPVPCAAPDQDHIVYNCGPDDVCKGDVRVTYACDFSSSCEKDNKKRFLGICEKP